MHIDNQFKLFLFSQVSDYRQLTRQTRNFEYWGDLCLAAFRELFREHYEVIFYYPNTIRVLKHRPDLSRTYGFINKIVVISSVLFSLILWTIPGFFLKSIAWITDKRKRTRNLRIIDLIKRIDVESAKNKANLKIKLSQKKVVPFQKIPHQVIEHKILPYLNKTDLIIAAKTNRGAYSQISNYLNHPEQICKELPEVFVKVLGKEKMAQLPLVKLEDVDCHNLFQSYHQYLTKNITNNQKASISEPSFYYSECLDVLRKCNSNFFGVETKNGPGLVLKIYNKVFERSYVYLFAKIDNAWFTMSDCDITCLHVFFNDIRWHQEVPKIEDYLTRLFAGKPCGEFAVDLNYNIDLTLNDKLSERLLEGPLVCADGVTPIIQLA